MLEYNKHRQHGVTCSCELCFPYRINPANGRKVCTPVRPAPPNYPLVGRWEHTNTKEVGECLDGCCADYLCDDCGHTWREELPQ